MSVNQHPSYKMRLPPSSPPTEEEMNDALSEAAATSMALDDREYDDLERAEIEEAHRKAVGRVRLNLYRMGRNPSEEGLG